MKKIKNLLLLAAFAFIVSPFAAKAASTITYDCPNGTGGKPGDNVTCNFHITSTDGINQFTGTVTPKGDTTIVSITPNSSVWTGTTTGGNVVLSANTTVTSKTKLFTVVYKISDNYKEGDPCGVTVAGEGSTVSTPEPTPTNPTNPDTGATLPYILVGAGAVLAIGAYLLVSKKEKFFRV